MAGVVRWCYDRGMEQDKNFSSLYAAASREARLGYKDVAFRLALSAVGEQLKGPIGDLSSVDDIAEGDMVYLEVKDGSIMGIVDEVSAVTVEVSLRKINKSDIEDVYLVGFGYPTNPDHSTVEANEHNGGSVPWLTI